MGAFYDGLRCSVRGISHEEKKRPCQDDSRFALHGDYAVVAAADGHGGDRYVRSDVGARVAVQEAVKTMMGFLDEFRDELRHSPEKHLAHLESRVIMAWRGAIQEHFNKNPLTEDEKARLAASGVVDDFSPKLYGSTLLYGALLPDCAFVSQLGDGCCVILDAGATPIFPVPEDERLGFNYTTSLCGSNAAADFRRCFVHAPSWQAIFLCTDGVADSYTPESLGKFVATLVRGHNASPEAVERQLREWLPELSDRGSRDDMTVACIYRKEEKVEAKQEEEQKKEAAEPGTTVADRQETK